jgi:methyl-accepting chemotaxis protein
MIVGELDIYSNYKISSNNDKMYSYNMYSINELHLIKENLLNIRSELLGLVYIRSPFKHVNKGNMD